MESKFLDKLRGRRRNKEPRKAGVSGKVSLYFSDVDGWLRVTGDRSLESSDSVPISVQIDQVPRRNDLVMFRNGTYQVNECIWDFSIGNDAPRLCLFLVKFRKDGVDD